MSLTDSEKLALLERYFTERPSPLFGERLRLMELAFSENPIWMKRKLAEVAPTPAERLNAVANIRSKQSVKRQGATAPIPGAFSAALSTVSASPTSITTGASTVTVIVKDVNGNGLPGVLVQLAATGTGNTLIQPRFPTFADGLTTGTLSSINDGTKTVSATANGLAITQTVDVVVGETLPVTSGLVGWWRANGIVGLNNADPVGTWPDSSGNGRDVTQGTAANKPTYRTNVVNGRPVVRSDGVDDSLQNTTMPTAGDAYSVFAVAKLDAAEGSQAILGDLTDGPGNQSWGFFNDSGTTFWRVRDSVGNKDKTFATDLRGAFHLYEGILDGSNSFLFTDAISRGSVAYSAPNPFTETTLRLGQMRVAAGYALLGDLAEVVYYNRALTTPERQQVESFLMTKYAL